MIDPKELAAIRKRDKAMPIADRTALLAHIDAITEAVEGLPVDLENPNDPLIDKSSVLALLRGTP